MSSESLRKIVGVGEEPINELFYGYSTTSGLTRTSLLTLADTPRALLDEGYTRIDIDGLVYYCENHWRPTANVSPDTVKLGQQALTAFSQGRNTTLEAKVALQDLRQFAGDCVFEGWNTYPLIEQGFLRSLVDTVGLATELAEWEEEERGYSSFMSESIRWAAYGEEACSFIHEQANPLLTQDLNNIEGRRIVAASEFVANMSLAVGALYAAHCEGKALEGVLADRLNPLLGI